MNTTRTLEQIDAEIAQTKLALENVRGTETEVYARIVGYYRSIRNWNKGKKDEYKHRKLFEVENVSQHLPNDTTEEKTSTNIQHIEKQIVLSGNKNYSYEFYGRTTCPNCPPVKEYVAKMPIVGSYVDVDSEEGFKKASEHGVLAAPTVIIYDNLSNEVARAHNVQELETITQPLFENCSVAY